jgi:hypothetical protein
MRLVTLRPVKVGNRVIVHAERVACCVTPAFKLAQSRPVSTQHLAEAVQATCHCGRNFKHA